MEKRSIFLYSNQPVFCCRGEYYTRMKNFIDFLAELAGQDRSYSLVVPCKEVDRAPADAIRLRIPDSVIKVSFYEKHWEAIASSFSNAWRMRSAVKKALSGGSEVVLAGPGPNAVLFLLSYILPRNVRFAFFIRGDKVATLRSIYKGSPVYPFVVGLARVLAWRINSLLDSSRASVFLYNEQMRSQFRGKETDVLFIAPLVDGSLLRTDRRPDIREGHPLRVLYLGRLSGEKNVLALIEACAKAKAAGAPFSLTIAGFGPMADAVSNRVKELGLEGRVDILGYVKNGDETTKLFDGHDILCLPSHTEATPRAVVEAMARALPVIATPVGSLPHLFKDEVVFTDGFGAEDIFKAVTWCSGNRSTASELGRKGREKVKRFIIEENVKIVDDILRGERIGVMHEKTDKEVRR